MNLNTILLLVGLAILIIVIVYFLKRRKDYGKRIPKIPLDILGYVNIPAIPFLLKEIPGTLLKLSLRANATTQSRDRC